VGWIVRVGVGHRQSVTVGLPVGSIDNNRTIPSDGSVHVTVSPWPRPLPNQGGGVSAGSHYEENSVTCIRKAYSDAISRCAFDLMSTDLRSNDAAPRLYTNRRVGLHGGRN